VSREVLWSAGGETLTVSEDNLGNVLLMRSADFDSGPTRSIVLPKAALLAAGAALLMRHTKARIAGDTGIIRWDGKSMIVDGWVIEPNGETYGGIETVVDAVLASLMRERMGGVEKGPKLLQAEADQATKQ
jgi:hypothetical protein